MTNIKIEATTQSPAIEFDFEKAFISISGKSYPENVNHVYSQLLEAISNYVKHPKEVTTVNFDWLYYNTATSKIMIKILLTLKSADTQLNVNWFIKKGFKMMVDKAELIGDVMDIKVNIIKEE